MADDTKTPETILGDPVWSADPWWSVWVVPKPPPIRDWTLSTAGADQLHSLKGMRVSSSVAFVVVLYVHYLYFLLLPRSVNLHDQESGGRGPEAGSDHSAVFPTTGLVFADARYPTTQGDHHPTVPHIVPDRPARANPFTQIKPHPNLYMPRFGAAFRRKSTADSLENAAASGPSFRVLDRTEVTGGKSFDGGVSLANKTHHAVQRSLGSDMAVEENMFADLKSSRGSGSSNTIKTISTDDSSRDSNSSTAPSSTDNVSQEDWRNAAQRKIHPEIPVPPIPKGGFLKAAGRTFSFGGQKKHLPPAPEVNEQRPSSPVASQVPTAQTPNGRARATTSSTVTTLTPPRVDNDFNLDLGGDFGKMILGKEKRASAIAVKDDQSGGQALAPRSLTASRFNQPAPVPIQIDMTTKVEASPYSWSSQHSSDQLIAPQSPEPPAKENIPPPVPQHSSPRANRRPPPSPEVTPKQPLISKTPTPDHEEGEDEEARLLRDSLSTVSKFMTGSVTNPKPVPSTARYRRDEDDDSLFDTSHSFSPRGPRRFATGETSSPSSNKVMTPAEFEKYRKDKERQDRERQIDTITAKDKTEDDEDNYEEDEDDIEKAKQQAKQRRKQEAHMAVYRQQMMKVTGEAANPPSSRPSLSISFSTPNLPNLASGPSPGTTTNTTDPSDEDEEIPLAILAAHGFPSKNRPPTRLSTMASNPNMRASQQVSYQRPVSVVGDISQTGSGRLPAFARNLPQDPFLGAGLVRNSVRESFSLGGGSPAPAPLSGGIPPGGLVGVIANEERNRALRRGSPHIEASSSLGSLPGSNFDPIAGIPAHMMYSVNPQPPAPPSLTPGDQAQIQMTQQMHQFMQMQMQFMQMVAGQNGGTPTTPSGHVPKLSVGSISNLGGIPGSASMLGPGMGMGMGMGMGLPGQGIGGGGTPEMRRSFLGGNDSILDLGRGGEAQLRTMSMVQPSSASWIQPPQHMNFAPSIRIQGGGYTPSIAPSERSNVGLPNRYRPVSHIAAPITPAAPIAPGNLRKSVTMSGAIPQLPTVSVTKSDDDDDDDEQGWAAMKAKREKRKSTWKNKQSISSDFGALIS
ncbi:hypothetical protein QBC43DRAFT_377865 [Cladorrhinum sp. PSN259]|nr:hypothetical protein QBC43DRAFT_377865 [Cladorrhinum sp. PSN259]